MLSEAGQGSARIGRFSFDPRKRHYFMSCVLAPTVRRCSLMLRNTFVALLVVVPTFAAVLIAIPVDVATGYDSSGRYVRHVL